jgi:two-component system chemotaxis response regulator CheY
MKKILIIDKDPYMIRILEVLFRRTGNIFLKVKNNEDEISEITTQKPDLIIYGLTEPIDIGLQKIKQIKGKPETKYTPIIVIAEKNFYNKRKIVLKAGVKDFITKPFTLDKLAPIIQKYIEQEGTLKELKYDS